MAAMDIADVRRQLEELPPEPPPMSKQKRRMTEELAKASKSWTLPAVVRNYESGNRGDEAFTEEASIWAEHGYQPALQSADGGHIHAGRILLTGGLSVFAGKKGIREQGKLTVTFMKQPVAEVSEPPPGPLDAADQIAKFAALRDQGILTEDEFQTKKRELLGG